MRVYEQLGLPGRDDEVYWDAVDKRAKELNTDGCSGPTLPVYVFACLEHDIHYRVHTTLYGYPITRKQADTVFRERHQAASPFGCVSPMAWWRWAGLRIGGGPSWDHDTAGSPIADRKLTVEAA